MAPLDESDYDEPRPGRATRPAWDAATYGTPDDLRRWPGGRDPRRETPAEVRSPAEAASSRAEVRSPAEAASSRAEVASAGYLAETSEPAAWEPPAWEPPRWDPPAWEEPKHEEPRWDESKWDESKWDESKWDESKWDESRPDESRWDPPAWDPSSTEPYPASESYPASEQYRASSESYSADLYPGGVDEDEQPAPEPKRRRAGRDLPAAIGVGVGLGAIAAGSLFFWRPAFLAVLAVVVGIGIWELVRAIRTSGVNPPLIPLIAGGGLMTGLAWWGHTDALTFGLLVTVLAIMIWRLADGVDGYGRDVTSASLVAVYLPFLAGFAAMLASPADGDLRVVVTLAGVVLSDTGGYIAGVLFGKHPMAPSVSPKKSWEGLAGSLVATGVGGAVLLPLAFDVHWYWGVLFGVLVSAAAVVGDLGESMIKRDLGVKDMSNLLPGHGGFMDRLDSILIAAPTAFALLTIMAPAA
jgi:phosphatidate cytidylyltransferase